MAEQRKEVRANLRLVEFDLLSLVRTGFLISISIAAAMISSTVAIYLLLSGMGVFSSIDHLLGDITGGAETLTSTVDLPLVISLAFTFGAFEVLVTTSLVTLFGFIYNLTVPMTRGLQVTLAEDRSYLEPKNQQIPFEYPTQQMDVAEKPRPKGK